MTSGIRILVFNLVRIVRVWLEVQVINVSVVLFLGIVIFVATLVISGTFLFGLDLEDSNLLITICLPNISINHKMVTVTLA